MPIFILKSWHYMMANWYLLGEVKSILGDLGYFRRLFQFYENLGALATLH